MPEAVPPKSQRIAIVLALLVAAVAVFFVMRRDKPPEEELPVADLGSLPDWSRLQAYAGVVTREKFESELTEARAELETVLREVRRENTINATLVRESLALNRAFVRGMFDAEEEVPTYSADGRSSGGAIKGILDRRL